MRDYKYEGETFKLDDSNSGYVEVTYKDLTGYIGVNIGINRGDEQPYVWFTSKYFVTPDGLTGGNSTGASFKDNLAALCDRLLKNFRTEEAAKAFNTQKYHVKLHEAVKNLP